MYMHILLHEHMCYMFCKQVHVFGHIHEGYGVTSDEHTSYINASTCTFSYRPDNPPIVCDLTVEEDGSK